MAIRKQDIRLTNEGKRIRTKRVTSHYLTNDLKLKRLFVHFRYVRILKNAMSRYVYASRWAFLNKDLTYELQRHYKSFKSTELSAWETQQIFAEVMDNYKNSFDMLIDNFKFSLQQKIVVKRYKKATKLHKKGDIKLFTLKHKQTPLTRIANALLRLPEDQWETYVKGYKDTASDVFKAQVKKFNKYLVELRSKSNKWTRLKRLLKAKQTRFLKRIKPIVYQKGSYRKAVKENPSLSSKNSFVFHKPGQGKFQYFYQFKIAKKDILYVPLSINHAYHRHFKDINLQANHTVSLSPKGKLVIGLPENYEPHFEKTLSPLQICGIDLNVKHNFCVAKVDKHYYEFDYDREFINRQIVKLKQIDALGYNRLSPKDKIALAKIVRQTQSYFQKVVSRVLDCLQAQAVTEIVLENLNLGKSASKYSPIHKEWGVNYNRLVRILRLNNIKHWFRNQGNKRGIRAHLTSPVGTSQECDKCHTIDRRNRPNQTTFHCIGCGHQANADKNAACVIGNRIREDVLLEGLHIKDSDSQYSPKKLRRDSVKAILMDYYKKKPSLNGGSPSNLDCLAETHSKSTIWCG